MCENLLDLEDEEPFEKSPKIYLGQVEAQQEDGANDYFARYIANMGECLLEDICQRYEDDIFLCHNSMSIITDKQHQTALADAKSKFLTSLDSPLSEKLLDQVKPLDIFHFWQAKKFNAEFLIQLYLADKSGWPKKLNLNSHLCYNEFGEIDFRQSVDHALNEQKLSQADFINNPSEDEKRSFYVTVLYSKNSDWFNQLVDIQSINDINTLIVILTVALMKSSAKLVANILKNPALQLDNEIAFILIKMAEQFGSKTSLKLVWQKIFEDNTEDGLNTLVEVMKGEAYPIRIRELVVNPIGCNFLWSLFPKEHEGRKLLKNEIIDTFCTANLKDSMTKSQKYRYIYSVMNFLAKSDPEFLKERLLHSMLLCDDSGFFTA